ncbi:MAG: universal stress protein [Pseudomonadota bacterium]
MTPKKILFCTDFSMNSEPARRCAVAYAEAFGAELLLVHVIDSSGFPSYLDWVGDELDQILRRTKDWAQAKLDDMAKECAGSVKSMKTLCKVGVAAHEIVYLAEEESADLIVVGTHGHTGVKHLVMGSIARSVLRMAHRPVLIVEAPV